eukprot:c24285_g1_i1 orf=629-1576(-)
MQHDEVIWQIINHGHCSFKTKTQTQNFCRNVFNVSGLCNRSSCPLANSRYATVREHDGVLFLYMKSIERAHAPKELWERIKLPRNYGKALDIIDKYLEHWPKFLVHKNKQRLTKMTQYLIRKRKLALKVREKIVTMPAKQVKREARREAKAEIAAVLDKAIEKELLQRLQSGTYGDIYNFPLKEYEKVLAMEEMEALDEEEEDAEEEYAKVEYVEGYEMEEEEDLEDFASGLGMEGQADLADEDDLNMSDGDLQSSEEEEDDGGRRLDLEKKYTPKGKRYSVQGYGGKALRGKKRAHVEIEYEGEPEEAIKAVIS